MNGVSDKDRERLSAFAKMLVDQERALPLVPPHENREGYWFGGGNLSVGPDGSFYLVGRYRDAGDSRSGLGGGPRGVELAVFRSRDRASRFERVASFSKRDLGYGAREVLSIEGAKLLFADGGVELFVSSEKTGIPYPAGLEPFQKPGTGVWSIDHLLAPAVEGLAGARVEPLIEGADPRWLHVKDPVVRRTEGGGTLLYFCTHPFNWSSANTGMALRPAGGNGFGPPDFERFPRGCTWDVAAARVTGFCPVPALGAFARRPALQLVFYDGAESMRRETEHPAAVHRPRGYSCEELGGVAVTDGGLRGPLERLSTLLPFFVSPHGTGCSRYVDVLDTPDSYYCTWQQSQPDLSQPLVLNVVSREAAAGVLA